MSHLLVVLDERAGVGGTGPPPVGVVAQATPNKQGDEIGIELRAGEFLQQTQGGFRFKGRPVWLGRRQ